MRAARRGLAAILGMVAMSIVGTASDGLVVGRLTWVGASDEAPYAYWYYVPESVLDGRIAGLVWHATPGGADPDDPAFWARFDLPQFLACRSEWARPPVNLPEARGFVLFSVVIPRPDPAFYVGNAGSAIGFPDALSSLGLLDGIAEAYRDPDRKALDSIDDLKRRLCEASIRFDPRLFVTGVYRGAEWAHRFTLLHPTEVRAVAAVCGNVYTIPIEELADEPLPWPLGLAGFDALGRGGLDWEAYRSVVYYVVASSRENVWYNEMTPEQQGIEAADLARYVDRFGSIPPEREASLTGELVAAGIDCRLVWSEGGHGWIDAVRSRVFDFFAGFALATVPPPVEP